MSLGISHYIRKQYPQATITWVCGEIVATLLRATNAADQLITVNEQRLFKGKILTKILELLKLWHKVFLHKFDVVCIGHADLRYRLLALPVRAKIIRSFRHYPNPIPLPGRYHANEYLRLITGEAKPTITAKLPQLKVTLPNHLLQLLPQNSQPNIALAPGGAKNILRDDQLRRWPIANYVALAQKIIASGYNVILTGGLTDEECKKEFAHLPIVDLIGKTSLLETIALYNNCQIVITHDTGSLHLAKLSTAQIIALFGPTIPSEKVDVTDSRIHVLWEGNKLACCPCYDGKSYATCTNNPCLQKIAIEQVFELVASISK